MTKSSTGKFYFMTSIDDYSRRVWIFFLTHKDEAIELFKNRIFSVQTQTGKKVKVIRTENGLEFVNAKSL